MEHGMVRCRRCGSKLLRGTAGMPAHFAVGRFCYAGPHEWEPIEAPRGDTAGLVGALDEVIAAGRAAGLAEDHPVMRKASAARQEAAERAGMASASFDAGQAAVRN